MELGEDIELSCVVQDFCLVTVASESGQGGTRIEKKNIQGLLFFSFRFWVY